LLVPVELNASGAIAEATIMSNPKSTASIAGHPIHPMLIRVSADNLDHAKKMLAGNRSLRVAER
jgi:hypothetical protein